jgi:DNA-binding MarR family transcriptional regulator
LRIYLVDRYDPTVTAVPQRVDHDPRRWTTVDHLHTVSRDLQRRLAVALARSGHHRLRPSFGPLLDRLRDGALPVGQVATALNVSPQAASQATLLLERCGYVARSTSAVDGRSRVVALTSRGADLMALAGETFVVCDHAYEEILGPVRMGRFRRDIDDLRIRLELAVKPDLTALIPSSHSIGSVILIALWTKREIVTRVNRSHQYEVRRSHVELLSTISADGVRMSDVARQLGVTRQAVSAGVQELEEFGYVERRTDATDGRAVLIAPSDEGSELLERVAGATLEFEERCRTALGQSRWNRFARAMGQLAAAVTDEADSLSLPFLVRSVGSDRSTDLAVLAQGLRTRLGTRQAARLAALLTIGDLRRFENDSHVRTEGFRSR